MPRVSTKKKNKGGKAESYRCDSCSEPIVAGQEYFEWSFRYGGTHRQHITHGSPKSSQLTQSKMSGVYAAVEGAEDAIGSADCIDDLKAALDQCKEDVEGVKDEYQESLDNMISQDGSVAQEVQEKIDALETFVEELENASSHLEEFEEDEPEEVDAPDPVAVKKWEDEEPEIGEGDPSPEHVAWAERDPSAEYDAWQEAHSEWENNRDSHFEDQRSAASDALGNLSI